MSIIVKNFKISNDKYLGIHFRKNKWNLLCFYNIGMNLLKNFFFTIFRRLTWYVAALILSKLHPKEKRLLLHRLFLSGQLRQMGWSFLLKYNNIFMVPSIAPWVFDDGLSIYIYFCRCWYVVADYIVFIIIDNILNG